MDALWELLKSVIMGIVQGITEWLPISSTAHLKLAQTIIPLFPGDALSHEFSSMYDVVIQLGSILAVVVLYFHRLNPFSPRKKAAKRRETLRLWGKVLIASIPAAVVGLLIDDWLDALETDHQQAYLYVIAGALIVYGLLFIIMENAHRRVLIRRQQEMKPLTALGIGLFQMLALIPGTSRSGSTILGATLLGTSRPVAAEFSFFMAIPVMIGASGIKLLKAAMRGTLAGFSGLHWASLLIGFAVSFLVSVLVIRLFMNYLKRHDFKVFGVYRILIGIVVLIAVPTLLT